MKLLKYIMAGLVLATAPISVAASELRLGVITPPPHQWTVTANKAGERIAKETDGRVKLLVFPSGQLGNEAQMLQQLQSGALDFAFLTLGEFANRDPNYGIFLAPYLIDDVAGAREILKGKTAKSLLDGVSQFGLVGFGYGMAGMRQIVMSDEVKTVDDIAGRKIRTVPFAPELAFWEEVGAAPTPMPLPALYDAFANGQIDGMQIDFELTWNVKYYEHAGTIIESNHMMFPMIAVGSGRKWQSMSEADKAVIEAAFADAVDELVGSYADIDARYLGQLKKTDVPVIKIDRKFFGESIDDWYAQWRTKAPMLVDIEAEAAKLR